VHPDPSALLAQAETLYTNSANETDIRRVVSTAYYAVFHYMLRAAADLVIGRANRGTFRYNLAYCNVEHKRVKTLCGHIRQRNIDIQPYTPPGGFGEIVSFAELVLNLREERHRADYHPEPSARFDDARTQQAISDAWEAIRKFEAATVEQREAFLTLLLFEPRKP